MRSSLIFTSPRRVTNSFVYITLDPSQEVLGNLRGKINRFCDIVMSVCYIKILLQAYHHGVLSNGSAVFSDGSSTMQYWNRELWVDLCHFAYVCLPYFFPYIPTYNFEPALTTHCKSMCMACILIHCTYSYLPHVYLQQNKVNIKISHRTALFCSSF